MNYTLHEMLTAHQFDRFAAWAHHPQVPVSILQFSTDPVTFVHTEHAALLVYEAAVKAWGDSPDSMELSDRSFWFAGAVECFTSRFWRGMARHTFSLVGWADNQTDGQELIVESDLWETKAMSNSFRLDIVQFREGFVGMLALHDEGFIGGPVFIVEYN